MAEDPGKANVGELVKAIHNGQYVIPYFQRGYEWEPSMVSDLFESILQDYYAGLILFGELDANRARKEVWDPVWGAKKGNNPTQAILDGQQRLASLYYAIYNPQRKFPNRETYYRWFLNLDKCLNEEYEEAVYYRYSFHHHSTEELKARKDEWVEKGVIPLAILSDSQYLTSQDFEDWLQRYVRIRQERGIIPETVAALRVANLIRGIMDYAFITTTLSKIRNIHDICNIFANQPKGNAVVHVRLDERLSLSSRDQPAEAMGGVGQREAKRSRQKHERVPAEVDFSSHTRLLFVQIHL